MDYASLAFQSSRQGSILLVDAITNHEVVCLTDHLSHLDMVRSSVFIGVVKISSVNHVET